MDKNKVTEFLKHRVLERFALGADAASQEEVNSNIHKGIMIRGTNLWVLIFAIFIASLGLNTNSTAVIIGAMLISPLMGPIIGMGYSMGVYDFNLLKESLRNFLFMIVVSLITSAVFFTLPLITSTQSELLARTQPTTYDILIALFGGLAGMVAQTRKDRTGTVIPGVAIATALMPPLCTVGYGLATFQFRFMLGALYLFTINSIFIALASFIAFIAGSFTNAYVMSRMKLSSGGRNFSARAVLSTVFGEGVDSVIFFPLALGGVIPWEEMPSLMISQVTLKTLYEIAVLPVTIRVVEFAKRHDHEDVFDKDVNYNIFNILKI